MEKIRSRRVRSCRSPPDIVLARRRRARKPFRIDPADRKASVPTLAHPPPGGLCARFGQRKEGSLLHVEMVSPCHRQCLLVISLPASDKAAGLRQAPQGPKPVWGVADVPYRDVTRRIPE
jgi:hypothetical protein